MPKQLLITDSQDEQHALTRGYLVWISYVLFLNCEPPYFSNYFTFAVI